MAVCQYGEKETVKDKERKTNGEKKMRRGGEEEEYEKKCDDIDDETEKVFKL